MDLRLTPCVTPVQIVPFVLKADNTIGWYDRSLLQSILKDAREQTVSGTKTSLIASSCVLVMRQVAKVLCGVPDLPAPQYPWLFTLPQGRVLNMVWDGAKAAP